MRNINSRAAMASLWGPKDINVKHLKRITCLASTIAQYLVYALLTI